MKRRGALKLSIFLMLLMLIAFRDAVPQSQSDKKAAPIPLVEMPFQNETGDASWDWLSYGLIERLPFGLVRAFDTRSNFLWMPDLQTMKMITPERMLQEVRLYASRGYLVWGRYRIQDQGELRVSFEVVNIETGESVITGDSAEATGTLIELSLSLPETALQVLKTRLNVDINKEDLQRVQEMKPISPKTWKIASEGYAYLITVKDKLQEQEESPSKAESITHAIGIFEKAVQLDPEYNPGWDALGGLRLLQHDIPGARVCLERALNTNKWNAGVMAALGISYLLEGQDTSRALEYLNRSVDINPSLTSVKIFLVAALLHVHQISKVFEVASDLSESAYKDGRTTALRAASLTNDAAAVPILKTGLKDPFVENRIEAIQLLTLYAGEPSVQDALLEMMKDQDIKIRLAVLEAMPAMNDIKKELPLLQKSIEDPDKDIRVAATHALENIDYSSVFSILENVLKDQDEEVREAAMEGLAYRQDVRVRPILLAALKDDNPKIRLIAVRALSEEQDPEVESDLNLALHDQDPEVRAAALPFLRNQENVPALIEAIKDPDPRVKEAAISQLALIRETGAGKQAAAAATQALSDVDPVVRREAVGYLGSVDEPEAAQAIRKVLDDPDKEVRAAAIRALAWKKNPDDAQFFLSAMTDPDPEIQAAAAEALSSSNNPEVLGALFKSAATANSEVRRTVLFRLGTDESSENSEIAQYFLKSLQDPDAEVRTAALSGLVRMKHPMAESILHQTLNGSDKKMRALALRLYMQSENCCETDLVVKNLQEDDESLSSVAIQALGRSNEPEATSRLLLLLTHEKENVRVESAQALSRKKEDDRVTAALVRLLSEDTSSHVRARAASALAGRNQPKVISALSQCALHDSAMQVRMSAISTLGRIESTSAVPALLGLLEDPSADLRQTVIEALASMGDTRALPYLMKAADSEHNGERRTIASALGSIKSAEAVPLLIKLLNDPDLPTREAAIYSLGAIGSSPAVDGLLQALKDQNQQVSVSAIRALSQTEDPRRLPALQEAAHSSNKAIQSAASQALESSDNQ